MGLLFSRLFDSLFGSKQVRILILGLDNAGKTVRLVHFSCRGARAATAAPALQSWGDVPSGVRAGGGEQGGVLLRPLGFRVAHRARAVALHRA